MLAVADAEPKNLVQIIHFSASRYGFLLVIYESKQIKSYDSQLTKSFLISSIFTQPVFHFKV